MEALVIVGLSVAGSVLIGYLGVATERGAERLRENETAARLISWVLLVPVIDALLRQFDRAHALGRADSVRRLRHELWVLAGYCLLGIVVVTVLWLLIGAYIGARLFELGLLLLVVAAVILFFRFGRVFK